MFNNTQLGYVLDQCSRRVVRQGQVISEPGKPQDKYHFLLSGKVSSLQSEKVLDANTMYPLHHSFDKKESLIAKTDCSFIEIDRSMLDRLICWSESLKYIEDDIANNREYEGMHDWIHTLLSSNLFYKVSPLNIEKIFIHMTPVEVSKGEDIVKQGDTGDCCYFIKSGDASVYRIKGNQPEPVKLATISVGRCFGEDALIQETVRNATVTMDTDGLLMKLEKRDFLQLLKDPVVERIAYPDLQIERETDAVMIDVRTLEEYRDGHFKHAKSMPLAELNIHARLLNRFDSFIVYCDSGLRSMAAAHFLGQKGFRVKALHGGLNQLPEEHQSQLVH